MENRLPHTVSGLSAGAFMAVQHHVVWSNDVDGVGAIAGGPFWCANANAITAQTACMKEPGLINISELLAITTGTFVTGFIDNPRNLRGDRVWLFSGDRDTEVLTGVVRKLADYYLKLGVDAADLTTVLNVSAEHAMPTLSFGNPCSYFGPPCECSPPLHPPPRLPLHPASQDTLRSHRDTRCLRYAHPSPRPPPPHLRARRPQT